MIKHRWTAAVFAASACLCAAALWEGKAIASDAPPAAAAPTGAAAPLPNSPADLQRGRALFMGTCGAYCHKLTPGAGDAPFLFDCDLQRGFGAQDMFNTISHGRPNTRMVAFGGAIPDADIWRIVAYLRSAVQCPAGAAAAGPAPVSRP
jgi:mono/diheme cytochrome c family protein